jgi:hypothetical protein
MNQSIRIQFVLVELKSYKSNIERKENTGSETVELCSDSIIHGTRIHTSVWIFLT